jgi:PPOX class probable F420-dependent enzyme
MGENKRSSIAMTDAEIAVFIDEQRTATFATIGPTGLPHLVAMWYCVLDGDIWIETKTKSQKALNLIRDDRISLLIEAGEAYEELRGVSIEGRGKTSVDKGELWRVGVGVFERHFGPYREQDRPQVEAMLNNRIAVQIEVARVRSWDHRKLVG